MTKIIINEKEGHKSHLIYYYGRTTCIFGVCVLASRVYTPEGVEEVMDVTGVCQV